MGGCAGGCPPNGGHPYSIRAFQGKKSRAARHLSITRAADELALTQAAVSRKIAALESELGVARPPGRAPAAPEGPLGQYLRALDPDA